MNEKLVSNAQKKVSEKSRQELLSESKKPFQEPILTRHETLVQNTHISSTGVSGGLDAIGG